ncbi:hypothetical protein Goarm_001109 [Gossypium armourianum]|uniref:Uncharacterized protein n=1 Tax=Gossypium armourianum TaxID=34283 RepID=A0A7J9KBX4_9ROSI|nr:hypothetical protein [Gossypium armourianum]
MRAILCTPKETAFIPLIQEFYASLKDEETRRPHEKLWKIVTVKEKENMYWTMDPSKYEVVCQWPEGWDFLSPFRAGTLQKRREGKKIWTSQYHLNEKNSRELGEGLRALNYLPDMLGATRTHLKAEDEATLEDKGEEDEHNLLRDEDKYEAAFQLQYPTPKGPIIRSPTHLTPLTSRSSHQGYGMGKGKAPMKIGHFPYGDDSD